MKQHYNGTLYLIRGLSGSGKSTLAEELLETFVPGMAEVFEADKFFCDAFGNYNWSRTMLASAHKWCQESVKLAMMVSLPGVIVSNTFTSLKEMKPYLDMAEEFQYRVVSLIVENRHGNKSIHDVPEETLDRQERKLRGNIKLR